MRFVLTKYMPRAAAAERKAAQVLLARADRWVGIGPPVADPGRPRVFISCHPDDRAFADAMALALDAHGVGEEPRLEEAPAYVLVLSPSTRASDAAVSRDWASILDRHWADPSVRLVAVLRGAGLEPPPPFLQDVRSFIVRGAGRQLSTAARAIAQALTTAVAGTRRAKASGRRRRA